MIDLQKIKSYVGGINFSRGEDYAHNQHVIRFNIQKTNDVIKILGLTKGSENKKYQQTIVIKNERIVSTCTCPMNFACKHVAAVLLEAMHKPQPTLLPIEKPQPPAPTAHVDPEFYFWLEKLEKAKEIDSIENPNDFSSDVKYRVIYVLEPEGYHHRKSGIFTLYTGQLISNGAMTIKPFSKSSLDGILKGKGPKYLRPIDEEIFQERHSVSSSDMPPTLTLAGKEGERILEMIVTSRRGYVGSVDGPMLKHGDRKKASLNWQIEKDGLQHPCVKTDGPHLRPLVLHSLHYVDTQTGEVGPLDTEVGHAQTRAFLSAPRIKPEQAVLINQKVIHTTVPDLLPKIISIEEKKLIKPLPVLKMHAEKLLENYSYYRTVRLENAPIGTLFFRYGDTDIPFDGRQNGDSTMVPKEEGLIRINRHIQWENKYKKELQEHGFRTLSSLNLKTDGKNLDQFACVNPGENEDINHLNCLKAIDQLRDKKWIVDCTDYAISKYDIDDIVLDVDESSGTDWFDLNASGTIEGNTFNLVPVLISALKHNSVQTQKDLENLLAENASILSKISENVFVSISTEKIKPILKFLVDFLTTDVLVDGKIRLNRYRFYDLVELNEQAAKWRGGDELRQLAKVLKNSEIEKIHLPSTFMGELRPYQQQGVDWMCFLKTHQLGGLLADDMGLGKTVQALAYLLVQKAENPALIITPTSLISNWVHEAKRFAPSLRVLVLHGAKRKEDFEHLQKYDIVLTTYPLLSRDKNIYLDQTFSSIILDEAQIIKNVTSQVSQVAYKLKGTHKICLSGTPLENHLGELWSLMHFLMPGFLGVPQEFRKHFRTPIEKHGDKERQTLLINRIRPFMLRRTKQQVATELPDKQISTVYIPLSDSQKLIYESVRVAMDQRIRDALRKKGLNRSHIEILDALLKLRQVCCDPRLLKKTTIDEPSTKLLRLIDMLKEMVEEGRRILIFSQFTSMISLIEKELEKNALTFVTLTGETKKRGDIIDAFQNGTVPIFLISLKAGGTGLNLTTADTVIHYDPWWNPAVEAQATDRAHRIGQTKKVFVYKLIAEATVEEKIINLQERKQQLLDSVIDQSENATLEFTAEDYEDLFKPITQIE